MQIVIDIPEILYTKIQNGKADKRTLETVILYGTQLPKGHGKLIDADALDITTITTDDYSGNEILDVILKEDIDDAPTIIEADDKGE